jgi:hypothetical protein
MLVAFIALEHVNTCAKATVDRLSRLTGAELIPSMLYRAGSLIRS